MLPEHHGVWDGEHPLSEGRVWRVGIRSTSLHVKIKSFFKINSLRSLVYASQLGGLRALQLLWPAVCAGEGRLPSL